MPRPFDVSCGVFEPAGSTPFRRAHEVVALKLDVFYYHWYPSVVLGILGYQVRISLRQVNCAQFASLSTWSEKQLSSKLYIHPTRCLILLRSIVQMQQVL